MIPWFLAQAPATGATIPAADADWFSSGTLSQDWTLARTAAALGRGADGRWASFAASVPRPYHDPTSLTRLGILLEPAATQLVFRSRSAAGAVGVAANASTVSVDAAAQTPLGLGASRIIPTTAAAQHGFNVVFGTEAAALGDNATVTVRAVVKPLGTAYPNVEFFLRSKANVYSAVGFSLTGTGSVVSNASSLAAAIRLDTDGYYEIVITMAFGAGTTAAACNMLVEPAAGTRSFAGDGTSGTYLAYLGAELGTAATSPILSDGTASVTRPADALTSDTDWLGPGPRTLGLRYAPLSAGAQTVLHAGGGTDRLEIRHAAGSVTYAASAGGVVSAQLAGTAPAPGVMRTVVVVAAADQFRLAQEGTVLGTDSAGALPADLPTMRLGSGAAGAEAGPMILNRMKYWRRALTAAEAEAYSADINLGGRVVALPSVEIQATRTVTPAETSITMVLTLTGEPTGPTVAWRTVDGTAVSGTDYVGNRGTARFVPGEYSTEITVALATRSTTTDRTFAIELTGPSGCTLGNARCTVTLRHVVQQGPAASVQTVFGATLPAEWTLTRSTAARTRNASGIWVAVSANVHRHHYAAPGVSGILVQTASSEQCLFDAVDPGWTTSASTKTLDTTTATAFGSRSLQWRKDTTSGDHRLSLVLTSAKSDMPTGEYTLGMTLRPHGERYWTLRTKGIDNVWRQAVYDLDAAGAVVSQDAGTIVTVERDPFFSDTYNITLNRSQAAAAGVSAEVVLYPSDTFANVASGGGTARGVDIHHMQLEPGPAVGAPIVTTGVETAKVLRPAETLKAAGTWFQRQSYTLGIRYIRLRSAPNVQQVVHVRDTSNTTTADAQSLLVESGNLILRPRTGSAALATVTDGAVPVGAVRTSVLVVDHDSHIGLFDGGTKVGQTAVGTGGVAAPLVPTVLRVGSAEPGGGSAAAWLVQAVYLWDDPLADADAALVSGNLAYSPPPEPDSPPVVAIPTSLTVREGQTLAVPITKTGPGACTVGFRTRAVSGGATWSTDYTGVETTVSFLTGDTVKTVNVATVADAVADPGETLSILLETPVGCTLGNATGTVTITEIPTVLIPATASVEEGTAVSVPVSKIGTGACSVTVQTAAGTATSGTDYTAVPATVLTFGATETTKTVTVQTATDATTEGSESFNINLSSPTDCVLGTAQCAVTITAPGTGGSVGTTYPTPSGFATSGNFGFAGSVYRVTSLLDTNEQGTLRHALQTAGTAGRLIVFEVGGVIRVTDRIRVGNAATVANVTVAGETAPPPGIVLQASGTFNDPIMVLYDCRNFYFSNICFEQIDHNWRVTDTKYDGFGTEPFADMRCENVWIDHCATFWSQDEAASIYHGNTFNANSRMGPISITNTMFCEPLWKSELVGSQPHWEGGAIDEPEHNFNLLLGRTVRNCDVQHCLFTEATWRNPWVDVGTTAVVANNLSLNCNKGTAVQMNDASGSTLLSVVGYLVISGPNTLDQNVSGLRIHNIRTDGARAHRFYASNLYGWQGTGATVLPKTTITYANSTVQAQAQPFMTNTRPIDCPTPVVALTAQQIYDRAVANVGPRPKERAIPSVARAITKLRNRSGRYVQLPSQVDGPTNLPMTTRSLGAAGAGSSPGNFPGGTPIPPMPTAGNATTMRAYIRAFKDQIQYD